MPEIFSEDALKAEVDKLSQLPPEQGGVSLVLEHGDVGVSGAVNKQLGKGWFVQGEGSWMRRAGYRVAAMFGWKGRS